MLKSVQRCIVDNYDEYLMKVIKYCICAVVGTVQYIYIYIYEVAGCFFIDYMFFLKSFLDFHKCLLHVYIGVLRSVQMQFHCKHLCYDSTISCVFLAHNYPFFLQLPECRLQKSFCGFSAGFCINGFVLPFKKALCLHFNKVLHSKVASL